MTIIIDIAITVDIHPAITILITILFIFFFTIITGNDYF